MISLLPLAENKQITRSASKALGHTNTLGPDLRAGRELQSPIAREEPEELDSNQLVTDVTLWEVGGFPNGLAFDLFG